MTKKISLLFVLIAITIPVLACNENETELSDVTFMAGFRPQANLPFVSVYVAEAKGFFAEEGLAVSIKHSTQGEHLSLIHI